MLRLKSFAMPTTNHTKPLTCSASRSRKSSRSSTTAATDRKSTRLNSSHLVISYAVFCLKKKKDYLPPPSPAPQPLAQRRSCPPQSHHCESCRTSSPGRATCFSVRSLRLPHCHLSR